MRINRIVETSVLSKQEPSEFNFQQKVKGAESSKPTVSPKRYITERIRVIDRTQNDPKPEAKPSSTNPERNPDDSFSFTRDRPLAAHSTPPQRETKKDIWNDSFGSFGMRLSERQPKHSPSHDIRQDQPQPILIPLVVNQPSSFNDPTPVFHPPMSSAQVDWSERDLHLPYRPAPRDYLSELDKRRGVNAMALFDKYFPA